MTTRLRQIQRQRSLARASAAMTVSTPEADGDIASVLVSSGIHRGRFPVGGMTVRAARRVLGPLINIDPAAVAVLNGQIASEDTVLEDTLGLLNFVKPSSLKG